MTEAIKIFRLLFGSVLNVIMEGGCKLKLFLEVTGRGDDGGSWFSWTSRNLYYIFLQFKFIEFIKYYVRMERNANKFYLLFRPLVENDPSFVV